jgi:aryl-alcohol dehydrogenase-like predicted oxidoreductase
MGVLSGKYLDGKRPAGARLTLYTFFNRYLSERGQAATRAYVELARRHNLDPAQMALAWVNSRPFVTSNIIGATTMDQLKSNIASADLVLSPELVGEIEALHREHTIPCP